MTNNDIRIDKGRFWNRKLAAIVSLFVVAVFIVSMTVPVEYIPFGGRYDKIKHALFFVVITLSFKSYLKTNIWLLGAGIAVFAALSEWMQQLIPHRSGNLEDLYADWIGIGLTCCVWQLGLWMSWFIRRATK
ncbi:MAG: hypothetical protein Alis3KO_08500 [Aliiglaciecola sp.]